LGSGNIEISESGKRWFPRATIGIALLCPFSLHFHLGQQLSATALCPNAAVERAVMV
jgi:hypothetical protein